MANTFAPDYVRRLFTVIGNSSFQGLCVQSLNRVTNGYTEWSGVQLVDQYGGRLTDFTDDAWGMTYASCKQYCTYSKVPFDYQTFSNSMTNYLLPWLALTAQLPFETGVPAYNMMALCMAVGSPALITYSLTITILNRSWARSYFAPIKLEAQSERVKQRAPGFEKRVSAAQFLVQEAQQVPLRCSQERGWLASLIVLPKNTAWWEKLEDRLKATRRGFSPSLVAQMGLAITAWLLTVIAAFIALLGDPGTALQIASSSLYIWLVPVIIGWILVGTQNSHRSIEDALRGDAAYRAKEAPVSEQAIAEESSADGSHEDESESDTVGSDAGQDTYTEQLKQKGIERRGGLSPQSHKVRSIDTVHEHANGHTDTQPDRPLARQGVQEAKRPRYQMIEDEDQDLKMQNFMLFSFRIDGDETVKGPLFNYARLFTWWQVVNTIGTAMSTTLKKIEAGEVCVAGTDTPGPRVGRWRRQHKKFLAHRETVSAYCGLDVPGSCKQYPSWSEMGDMPGPVYRSIFVASLMAIFIQWGIAGDSIMTAYLTPTTGLGCRSGSYLLYASMSTLAWMMLVVASLCSHQAMLQYQAHLMSRPGAQFRRPSIAQAEMGRADSHLYDRPWAHTLVCFAAVFLRVGGKLLCIVNTVWLIVTSIMEFIGGFDNCWCQAVYASRGESGFVVIFKTAQDLAENSAGYWGGGLAMAIVVVVLSVTFFAMGTSKPDDN